MSSWWSPPRTGSRCATGAAPTGTYLGELIEPTDAMLKAGFELSFATPGGKVPTIDGTSCSLLYFGLSRHRRDAALASFTRLLTASAHPPTWPSSPTTGIDWPDTTLSSCPAATRQRCGAEDASGRTRAQKPPRSHTPDVPSRKSAMGQHGYD